MKDFIRNKVRENLISENRVKMDIPIPSDIIKIKDIFVSNGHKLFVVGGAVRDALLGKEPKDWDLATDATPDKVEQMMKGAGLRTIPTGKSFGVINVFVDDEEFEIATFRRDVGTGRRPDSVEFTTIDQDVKRRDLTINALFFDIDTKEVVDLVGGIDDLRKGIVRTVGEPEERFGEDRLRILRAIRFAGRFGSGLDPKVEAALKKDNSLEGVSPERIRDEFLKGLKTAKSTRHFLRLINQYKLWDDIFPNIRLTKAFHDGIKDPLVSIALLLVDNDPSSLSKQLNKLTYSAAENKIITFLVAYSKFNDVNDVYAMKKLHMNSGVSWDQFMEFSGKAGLDQRIFDAFLDFNLSVTGADVEKLGIPKGPEMGKAIKQMEIDNFKQLI